MLRRKGKSRKKERLPEMDPHFKVLSDEERYQQHCFNNHPLLINVVLETLFSFLPLSTLIECRLVCQLWNDLCTPHAAKQCQPTIMNLDLASNLKDLTSPGSGFPYSKVVIHSVSIGNSKLNQHEQLAMIQTMAPFVTQIHLESFNKGYFPFNNYLPEDIRFSKLKSVHIQFTTLSDTQALAHNTQLLTRIMNRAPLLNQLTLTNLNQTVNITDLRKSLKECEQFCKIKKLSLSGPLQTSHLNVLTEMGQSLKELHMEFRHGSEVDTQVITDYLESHHLTLEQLTVEVHASGEMVKVELPRLEKLKGLKVFAGHFNSFRTQGESICYRNQLPALKSLELLAESCEYGFYEYDINFPATTLTSLVFPTTIESLSLGTAATMFPNLKSIQLPMRVEHIESLCLFKWKCSGMEELRLKTPSQHLGQCFAENVLQTDFTDDLNSTTLISSTTKKAAYFLQGLKVLKLVNDTEGISDETCEHVFLKLDNLRELHFMPDMPPTNVSEQMMQKMRKKFLVLVGQGVKTDGK